MPRTHSSQIGPTLAALALGAILTLVAVRPAGAQDATAHEAQIQQAERLLRTGDPEAAYRVLKPLEPALSGVPRFDYLLGIAAMDTGRRLEALFALERAVEVAPDDPLVRTAYANALLGANEADAAIEQVAIVRAQIGAAHRLPSSVQQDLDQFAEALRRPGFGQATDFRGYVGVSLGYDTNVNNATDDATFFAPGLNAVVTLPSGQTRRPDLFANLLGGASVVHPLRRDLELSGALSGNHRILESEHEFETTSFQGNVNLTYADEDARWTIGAFGQHLAVDMHASRNAFGLIGGGTFRLDPRTESSAFVQYTRQEYPAQAVRDSDRVVVGAGLRTLLPFKGDPEIVGRVFFGREEQDDSRFPNLGHNVVGASLIVSMDLDARYSVFAQVAGEQRDYNGRPAQNDFFQVVRDDQQYQASAGLTYRPARWWQVTPMASYTRNISNIPVNDFSFAMFQVSVIRTFN